MRVFLCENITMMIQTMREYADRLIRCGFEAASAVDICRRYMSDSRPDALEEYIRFVELVMDDRREWFD